MQAFVISLRRERKRRRESIRLISSTGLPYELVDAIDGRITPGLPCAPLEWIGLSNTEVACYASHLLALRRIVELDLPYALILEDDFRFLPGAEHRVVEIEPHLPRKFDYVCLHHLRGLLNPDYAVESRSPPFQKLSVAPLVACGYVISQALAGHMLRKLSLPARPIDEAYVALSRQGNWDFYDLIDPIIGLRRVPSTIR